jgi:N-terminal acetyltransferase B complex non-catalytic subunit
LDILAEKYFEIMSSRPLNQYKATNLSLAHGVDQAFVLESLARLNNSFNKLLYQCQPLVTSQEYIFYSLISLLTAVIPLAVTSGRVASLLETLGQLINAAILGIEELSAMALSLPPQEDTAHLLFMFYSLHGLSRLRDGAAGAKHAAAYIVAINEREKEQDRSGKSNLPKEVMANIKSLDSAATAALKAGKERVALLKKEVVMGNFNSIIESWVFPPSIGKADGDLYSGISDDIRGLVKDRDTLFLWVKSLAESWKLNVKGWEHVKWE